VLASDPTNAGCISESLLSVTGKAPSPDRRPKTPAPGSAPARPPAPGPGIGDWRPPAGPARPRPQARPPARPARPIDTDRICFVCSVQNTQNMKSGRNVARFQPCLLILILILLLLLIFRININITITVNIDININSNSNININISY